MTSDQSSPIRRPVDRLDRRSAARARGVGDRVYGFLRAIPASVLWLIVVIWSMPTLGLLVNSFRTRDAQRTTAGGQVVGDFDELTLDNYDTVLRAERARRR